MIIRKEYKAESAHVVRNCTSDRCKFSIHGHSSRIEVFLTSNRLDNGQMIVDFGILKNEVKDFIDSFDHAYLLWNKESDEFKQFIYAYSNRVIALPCSPSAESLSLLMLYVINEIVSRYDFANNEGDVQVTSVRYHETDTGYAEAFLSDIKWINYNLNDIIFSPEIIAEWKNQNLWKIVTSKDLLFSLKAPYQQII